MKYLNRQVVQMSQGVCIVVRFELIYETTISYDRINDSILSRISAISSQFKIPEEKIQHTQDNLLTKILPYFHIFTRLVKVI